MKMELTECSKMSAYKIQTPGNYPEESIQHSEHNESLKSRRLNSDTFCFHVSELGGAELSLKSLYYITRVLDVHHHV
jgi:hypothetical protein